MDITCGRSLRPIQYSLKKQHRKSIWYLPPDRKICVTWILHRTRIRTERKWEDRD